MSRPCAPPGAFRILRTFVAWTFRHRPHQPADWRPSHCRCGLLRVSRALACAPRQLQRWCLAMALGDPCTGAGDCRGLAAGRGAARRFRQRNFRAADRCQLRGWHIRRGRRPRLHARDLDREEPHQVDLAVPGRADHWRQPVDDLVSGLRVRPMGSVGQQAHHAAVWTSADAVTWRVSSRPIRQLSAPLTKCRKCGR